MIGFFCIFCIAIDLSYCAMIYSITKNNFKLAGITVICVTLFSNNVKNKLRNNEVENL